MKKWLFLAVGLILLFAAQRECAADGKFFPPLNVKAPDMPQQRAIIVHRNGVERLIIESAFQGETGEYAWILPVPSEPLEIKKASYPLFKTMFYDFGKRAFDTDEGASPIPLTVLVVFLAMGFLLLIVAEANGTPAVFTAWAAPACIAFTGLLLISPFSSHLLPHAAVFALVAVVLFVMRNKGARGIAVSAFLWMLVLAGFLTVLPGSMLKARGPGEAGIPGVQLLNVNTVADCEITTLKADNAEALDKWLEAGGFQTLGEAGRKIAGGYIAENWCFLVGKLHKVGNEPAAPSPIEVSFKADAPVYPMRLTALSGGPLYVDLIIVAEDAYECPLLQTEFTNSFRNWYESEPGNYSIAKEWRLSIFQQLCIPVATDKPRLRKAIWHSEAPTLLWEGCVISKLSGSLTAADMAADIRPAKGANGKLLVLLTEDAAKSTARDFGALIFFSIALLMTYPLALKRCFSSTPAPKKNFIGRVWPYAAIVMFSLVAGLAAWMAVSAIVPKAEVKKTPRFYDSSEQWNTCRSAFEAACRVPGGPAEKLMAMYPEFTSWPVMNDEMRSLLRQLAVAMEPAIREADRKNILTGEPVTMEESPGNLIIELSYNDKSIDLSVYDVDQYSHKPWQLASYPPYRRE